MKYLPSTNDTLTQNQVALGDEVHKVYYDVNLVDASGNVLKLESGRVRLVFGYPAGIDYTQYDFNVYHIKDSRAVENLSIEMTAEGIVAETDSLSPFVLTYTLRTADSDNTADDTINTLAGIIGIHEEGSIGMLYVKPQYRHQKLATALETYAFNRALENGWIPYGQIIVGNEASMKLQERMGLHFSKSSVYWMANNIITGHTVRCEQ